MHKLKIILVLSSIAVTANAWPTPISVEFRHDGYQLTHISPSELESVNRNHPLWNPFAITEIWGSFAGEDLNNDGTIRFVSTDYYNNYPSSELYNFRLSTRQIYPWPQEPIEYGFQLSTSPEPNYTELLRSFSFDLDTNALAYYADAPDPPAAGCYRAYRNNGAGYFEAYCSVQYTSDFPIELNIVSNVPEPGAVSLLILGVLSLLATRRKKGR